MKLAPLLHSLFLVVGVTAHAQSSMDQLLKEASNTWPDGQTVGIFCNYARSGETVRAMRDALPAGSVMKVADVRYRDRLTPAIRIMWRVKPHYVLLLPDDPLVHDGSWEARRVIQAMSRYEIPTLATTRTALRQGAWAVVGPDTGNNLLVHTDRQGFIGKITGVPIGGAPPISGGTRIGGRGVSLILLNPAQASRSQE